MFVRRLLFYAVSLHLLCLVLYFFKIKTSGFVQFGIKVTKIKPIVNSATVIISFTSALKFSK